MNEKTISEELERRLARSLRASAPRPAPGLADRLLRQTAATPQRRGWAGFGLLPAVAAAAAVVVIAVAVGLGLGSLLPRSDGSGIGSSAESIGPSPSEATSPEPSPTPSTEPSVSVAPATTECANEEFGFTIAYPAEWWANPLIAVDDLALDAIPACSYFAEEPVDLAPNAGVPQAVSISVAREEGPPPGTPVDYEVISTEETRVGGLDATIREIQWPEDTVFMPAGTRSYGYHVELPSGETIVIGTSSTATQGDYDDHKRVLDEMMGTFEVTGP